MNGRFKPAKSALDVWQKLRYFVLRLVSSTPSCRKSQYMLHVQNYTIGQTSVGPFVYAEKWEAAFRFNYLATSRSRLPTVHLINNEYKHVTALS